MSMVLASLALSVLGAHTDVEADMFYEHRLAYVSASVNGSRGHVFLIDTGANASALDSALADSLGIESDRDGKVEGSAGTITVSMTELDELSVGQAKVENLRVTLQDFRGFLKPSGNEVAGIIGSDYLNRFSVQFDFARKRISLSTSPAKTNERHDSVPMTLDNGIPKIPAVINGTLRTGLRIDTGASIFESDDVYVNVTERDWAVLGLTAQEHFSASGIGGTVQLKVSRVTSMTIGPVKVDKPYLIAQPEQGYFARPDAVGFVGNNLLEKYSPVTFDYLSNRLLLTRAFPGLLVL